MIEFGIGLRKAREAKGYTIGQIAEVTHIPPTTITALENEDFSHLTAPIYGRGFVKLYCEAVGLEAKPYVDEFMSIYNGERDIPIKERVPVSSELQAISPLPANTSDESPEPPPQEDQQNLQKPAEADSLFSTETTTPFPTEPPQPPPSYQDEGIKLTSPSPMTEEKPSLSRYASPLNNNFPMPKSFMLPSVWRVATLCVAALLALWLVAMGIRALYRATSAPTEDEIEQTQEEAVVTVTKAEPTAKAKPAAKPVPQKNPAAPKTTTTKKKDRQAQSIPSLYVD